MANPASQREGFSASSIAGIVIALAMAIALAKLLSAQRLYEPSYHRAPGEAPGSRSAWPTTRPTPMPTFSSNDRSRWATVRSLVDDGTFIVGKRDTFAYILTAVAQTGQTEFFPALTTAACGLSKRISSSSGISFEDGWQTVDLVLHPDELNFYSTKPPLLPIMVAGEYWIIKKLTGWTLKEHPFGVVRIILFTINLIPFFIYLLVFWALLQRFSKSDWACIYALTIAALGTSVLPFLNSFNNHTMATFSVLFAIYGIVRIQEIADAKSKTAWQGSFWFALVGLLCGFAVCNELPSLAFLAFVALIGTFKFPRQTIFVYLPCAALPILLLLASNQVAMGQWRPAYSEFGSPWYTYEGSHLRIFEVMIRRGIDWSRFNGESIATYTFHLLLGHHGFFSLTPVFLLALVALARTPFYQHSSKSWGFLALSSAIVGAVVIVFYIFKTDNYGGFAVGPRWLMWVAPIFLLTAVPVIDGMAKSKTGRLIALVLLIFAVLAANYPGWNAWRHPWIYDAMLDSGWPGY